MSRLGKKKRESHLSVPLPCSFPAPAYCFVLFDILTSLSAQCSTFLGCCIVYWPLGMAKILRHTIFSSVFHNSPRISRASTIIPLLWLAGACEALYFIYFFPVLLVSSETALYMYLGLKLPRCSLILDAYFCPSEHLVELKLHKNLSNHDFKNPISFPIIFRH